MVAKTQSVISKAASEDPLVPRVLDLNHVPKVRDEATLQGFRPASWRAGKKSLGGTYCIMPELLRGIELTTLGNSHPMTLAVAIHAFLMLDFDAQVDAMMRMIDAIPVIRNHEADRELHRIIGSVPAEELE